jgi:pyrroloquinoline quinone biosynthesis protein D
MTPVRPRLARKARLRWDAREQTHFLLWPERGLRLNATAAAIIELCDGEHSVEDIVRALVVRFPGDAEAQIAADVTALVEELGRRALLAEA